MKMSETQNELPLMACHTMKFQNPELNGTN